MANFIFSLLVATVGLVQLVDGQQISVTVDSSKASDLANFGNQLKSYVEQWYPRIREALYSPTYRELRTLRIIFDEGSWTAGGRDSVQIGADIGWYRSNQNDVGKAHLIRQFLGQVIQARNGPDWVHSGITDYIIYYLVQPENKPRKPFVTKEYTSGWKETAYFFNWLQETKGHSDFVSRINRACRENNYRDSLFNDITGKSVGDNWKEMRQGTGKAFEVHVNANDAPQLTDFGLRSKAEMERWYDRVSQMLASPEYVPLEDVYLYFDPNYGGVAYASDYDIVGAVQYYNDHQDDVGSMIHEMTHVIQQYRHCDGWVTEGIADWIRYYHYEPNRKPNKPGRGNSYEDGYGVTAYFLQWLEDNKRRGITAELNARCRKGNYNKNNFKELTGNTVDELWNMMMNQRSNLILKMLKK